MSWPEYDRACSAYEAKQLSEWERTREMGAWFGQFLGIKTKGGKPIGPKDLMKLSSDKAKALSPAKAQSAKAFRDEIEAKALAKK